jgi:hypothetical protein
MIIFENNKPSGVATDFVTIAMGLIQEITGEAKIYNFNMFPKEAQLNPTEEMASKNIVYVIAHGSPTTIVNCSSGSELGAKLSGISGITNKNTSKIVLVSCSTGKLPDTNPKNFAQQLASYMKIPVYGANDLISVHYNMITDPKTNQQYAKGESFSVSGIEVGVVNGEGLTRFDPK